MRLLPKLVAALIFLSGTLPASAGALYGTVRGEHGSLGAVKLLLACPGFAAPARKTEVLSDNGGGFALRVAGNGKCELRVQRGNQLGPPFDVYLSDNPIRFDFVVGSSLQRLR